jgi:acyl carrier protein
MDERLNGILCDLLELEPDEIRPDLMREEVEAWDSLNHLKIVSAVEEVFGVRLSMDEIQSIDGLPRLTALIAAHRPG